MCGIAGVVAWGDGATAPDARLLEHMAGALSHRGPDAFGTYRDERAGLAHARLSIIDPSGGHQPLASSDGQLWIAYNGEVYNYLELRAELEGRGHRFRTSSDTEVVVHAYQEWGDDAFARFNGQWAIALWDRAKRRLVLSRDPLGIAPLYVCEHEGRTLFASEVKALFADRRLPRELDPLGLLQVFTFWAPVAPRTVFKGVEELPPGHVRTYHAGRPIERAYFALDYSPARGVSVAESAERVRHALDRATSLRMLRADVPVGSYLSGGLDSSIVAALGRAAVGRSYKTFSLRFEDAEFDESPYQREVAERLETEHYDLVVRRSDIAAHFPDVIRHGERPILRTAPAPMFLLSKLVHETGIKVVLTGEGADEMFAGYDLFREGKVRRFWARQPNSQLRPRLLERLYPYLARSPVGQGAMARAFFGMDLDSADKAGFAHGTRWRTAGSLRRLLHADVRAATASSDPAAELLSNLPAEFGAWSALAQDQYLECRTLLSSYLLSAQGDRMLMAHSVEGRFPFLDRDVVEIASQLPDQHKLHVLDEKHVLKQLARNLVPKSVLHRPKQPYRAPDAACFLGPSAPEWLRDVISPRALHSSGLFDEHAVQQLFAKCEQQPPGRPLSNSDNMAVVGVVSTQLLHSELVLEATVPKRPLELTVQVDLTASGTRSVSEVY